jgi:pyruvate kinase
MDVWQVPLIQKSITNQCRQMGRPVIIATQMLQSMVENLTPTRAEVSDVANAILDGTDAVMLSAETAAGAHPVASVQMMQRVALTAESYLATLSAGGQPEGLCQNSRTTSAIAEGAARTARYVSARLVAAWTATGETARQLSAHRLPVPVVAATFDPRTWRRMNLLYGVVPLLMERSDDPRVITAGIDRVLLERRLASADDLIVMVISTRPSLAGATDTLIVHRVGQPLSA